MSRNRTLGTGGGKRLQAAVPHGSDPLRANGLLIRGAVIATYVPIDGPEARQKQSMNSSSFYGVFCDVLVYSRHEGIRGTILQSVPVAQNAGMHDGQIWKPKATTIDTSNSSLKKLGSDPSRLDGDHVLIQFLDDDLSQPIITGRAPHPQMAKGNKELTEAGHRMVLNEADGDVNFTKHRGSFYGVDKNGNIIINTTRANDGQLTTDGEENPANNSANGNVVLKLNKNAQYSIKGVDDNDANPVFELIIKDNEFTIKLQDGNSLNLTGKDAGAELTIGDGAKHVAIVEALKALYGDAGTPNTIAFFLQTHTHPDGFGSTAPPVAPVPIWDPTIESTKIKIPNG